MIEIVQAQEEQRLSPVERPEHAVLDRGVEGRRGVGGQHSREHRRAIVLREAHVLGDGGRSAELAWAVGVSWQGQGIASEAAQA